MDDMTQEQILREVQLRVSRYKLFGIFTNQQVYEYLSVRGIENFLMQIPSAILRTALDNRQEYEDRVASRSTSFRYNVLDMTLEQVIKHAWDNRLISYVEYQRRNQIFRWTNHPLLGMRLAQRVPLRYYVGTRSTHQQRARELEELYGVNGNQEDQEDQRQGTSSEMNDFIRDNDSQENDDFVVDDSEEIQRDDQNDQYLDDSSSMKDKSQNQQVPIVKKKRGRPPKNQSQKTPQKAPKRIGKRGRRPKKVQKIDRTLKYEIKKKQNSIPKKRLKKIETKEDNEDEQRSQQVDENLEDKEQTPERDGGNNSNQNKLGTTKIKKATILDSDQE